MLNRITETFGILAVIVFAIYESVLGLLQVLRIESSGHSIFLLTGSCDNPGPYGGILAILAAILFAYYYINRNTKNRIISFLSIVSLSTAYMAIVLLPATMSRAAWLSLAIAMLVLGIKELALKEWFRENYKRKLISFCLIVVLLLLIFLLKMPSAIGRLHIWHMEIRAIAEKPISGHGVGSTLGVYGETQARYFAEKERNPMIVQVAGCPEYAFNEYLKIGIEYGIPVMIAVILCIFVAIISLLKGRSPFAYGLIALAIFSWFSYPSSLLDRQNNAEKEWSRIRHYVSLGLYEDFINSADPLYDDMEGNYRYLYDYGYSLYKCDRFEESLEILKQGAKLSSDPMFYNIIGRNYEALGKFADAENAYLHAHYMVPQRLYPLVRIMRMYIRGGNNDQALKYAQEIIEMPINENHKLMQDLRNEAHYCLDSLRLIYTENTYARKIN